MSCSAAPAWRRSRMPSWPAAASACCRIFRPRTEPRLVRVLPKVAVERELFISVHEDIQFMGRVRAVTRFPVRPVRTGHGLSQRLESVSGNCRKTRCSFLHTRFRCRDASWNRDKWRHSWIARRWTQPVLSPHPARAPPDGRAHHAGAGSHRAVPSRHTQAECDALVADNRRACFLAVSITLRRPAALSEAHSDELPSMRRQPAGATRADTANLQRAVGRRAPRRHSRRLRRQRGSELSLVLRRGLSANSAA